MTLHPAYVFQDGDFKYHNFIGEVPKEFGLHPMEGESAGVEFQDENDTLEWVGYEDLLDLMQSNASQFHHGLMGLFKNSGKLIKQICQKGTAHGRESNQRS